MQRDWIFFDVGGTLLHIDWARVCRLLGKPSWEGRLRAGEGAGRREIDQRARSGAPASGADYLRAIFLAAGFPKAELDSALDLLWKEHLVQNLWDRIDPEAPDTLRKLSGAYTLGVISNSEGKVRDLLDETGLLGYFALVLDSALEGVSKPDPEIFRRACARAGVAPAQALYVGDIFSVDVLGALGAGMSAVLLDRSGDDDEPLPEGARRVGSLGELSAYLLP